MAENSRRAVGIGDKEVVDVTGNLWVSDGKTDGNSDADGRVFGGNNGNRNADGSTIGISRVSAIVGGSVS